YRTGVIPEAASAGKYKEKRKAQRVSAVKEKVKYAPLMFTKPKERPSRRPSREKQREREREREVEREASESGSEGDRLEENSDALRTIRVGLESSDDEESEVDAVRPTSLMAQPQRPSRADQYLKESETASDSYDSDSDSYSEESSSEDEAQPRILTFKKASQRTTLIDAARQEEEREKAEEAATDTIEAVIAGQGEMVEGIIQDEDNMRRAALIGRDLEGLPDDHDDDDDEEEYLAWRERELARIRFEREEREKEAKMRGDD
ncbi:hypothetical protein KIPB_009569, partial [Kipferlia bialata]